MTRILGIIPARGGSKGVPRKNIIPLNGKPLISYTIQVAQECNLLDRVILTSEDEEIIGVAKKYGLEVPFIRPAHLSEDHVADRPVLQHALNTLEDQDGYRPDLVIYLRPTIPFRKVEDIEKVIKKWQTLQPDSVRSVSPAEGKQHPYWMFVENEEGFAAPVVPGKTIDKYYRRQLLPPVYSLNGVVEGISSDIILNHEKLYGDRMALVTIPGDRAIDIDTFQDLEYAEFLMQKNKI